MLVALSASPEAMEYVESMGIKVVNNSVHYNDAYTATLLIQSYNQKNNIDAEVPIYDYKDAYARTMGTKKPFTR